MDLQQTIEKSVELSGISLMLGEQVTIRFKPAPPNHGVVFKRVDLSEKPDIELNAENYSDKIAHCVSVEDGDAGAYCIEHVLSALAGLRIDNILIELDGAEPPTVDGSTLPFVQSIKSANIVSQDVSRKYLEISQPISINETERQIFMTPSDEFKVTFVYDHPNLTQTESFVIDEKTYEEEIAPSRTFCFAEEVEMLKEQGLGKGGTSDNVMILNQDNDIELRFDTEPVRHKILDLVGDLYLLGQIPKAHITAIRSGHAFNYKLVQEAMKFQAVLDEPIECNEIYQALPHRFPFCLVDRIVEYEKDKRAVAIKNVTYNESHFQGHFPNQPVMPGVLQIEALAQLGAWLFIYKSPFEGEIGYFGNINRAKFRRPVIPGDQLRLVAEVMRKRRNMAKIKGKAYVDGELATECEFMVALPSEKD